MTETPEVETPAGSLLESIQVLRKAGAEFKHHAQRLEAMGPGNEHILSMARLYREAARASRVLARFQAGRMRREAAEAAERAQGITPAGDAEAHV
jgi:hypothetical protein